MNQTPFTIFELHLALYALDQNGVPLNQVLLGAAPEACTFGQTYKTKDLEFPGLLYSREIPIDEEHTIELRNVHLQSMATGAPTVGFQAVRGARYTLVCAWYDRDVTAWIKRTYSGVTTRGQKIEPDQIYQSLTFRAESLVEVGGFGSFPLLTPTTLGRVDYVNGAERVTLYAYNMDTAAFTPVDPALLAGRAAITAGISSVAIAFNGGAPALTASVSAMTVGNFSEVSGTLLAENPRLEFFAGSARIAALGASGSFVVPNLIEVSGNPQVLNGLQFFLSGGAWVMTIAPGVVYIPALFEA